MTALINKRFKNLVNDQTGTIISRIKGTDNGIRVYVLYDDNTVGSIAIGNLQLTEENIHETIRSELAHRYGIPQAFKNKGSNEEQCNTSGKSAENTKEEEINSFVFETVKNTLTNKEDLMRGNASLAFGQESDSGSIIEDRSIRIPISDFSARSY